VPIANGCTKGECEGGCDGEIGRTNGGEHITKFDVLSCKCDRPQRCTMNIAGEGRRRTKGTRRQEAGDRSLIHTGHSCRWEEREYLEGSGRRAAQGECG
jgi:hypothetical protein